MDLDLTEAERDLAAQPAAPGARDPDPAPLQTTIKLGAAASAASPAPPADATAQQEFGRLINELCARPPPPPPAAAKGFFAPGSFNHVLASYHDLRLNLAAPENAECWPAARDELVALEANNPWLADTTQRQSGRADIQIYLAVPRHPGHSRVSGSRASYYFVVSDGLPAADTSACGPRAHRGSRSGEQAKLAGRCVQRCGVRRFGQCGESAAVHRQYQIDTIAVWPASIFVWLCAADHRVDDWRRGGWGDGGAHDQRQFQTLPAGADVNVLTVAVVGFLCGFIEGVAKTALATASQAGGGG